MASFKDMSISFLLIALFTIAMFSFGQGLVTNHGLNESVADDERVPFSELQSTVEEASEQAEGWEESFTSDNIFAAALDISLFTIFGITVLVWAVIIDIWNLYTTVLFNIFGVSPIVIGVLTSILILALVFAGWRLIKTGE